MIRGPRLLLLGKQGAGKGTQASLLAEHYGVTHLATGEVLRAAARAGTHFGLEAKRYMDEGELVPDDITVGVVEERFGDNGELEHGFVLDGFPRTAAQAEELARILGDHDLDLVVALEVPTKVVLDRLAGRRVCKDCGAIYHVSAPPENPWVCDVCGGAVVQRDDDQEDAINRRLELYEQETQPLIAYYRGQGVLIDIDGVGETEAVFSRLVEAVDGKYERRAGAPA